MPDDVIIKAGGLDDKEMRDFKTTTVEFYCKDRMGYSKAVEGAGQEPVSCHHLPSPEKSRRRMSMLMIYD